MSVTWSGIYYFLFKIFYSKLAQRADSVAVSTCCSGGRLDLVPSTARASVWHSHGALTAHKNNIQSAQYFLVCVLWSFFFFFFKEN